MFSYQGPADCVLSDGTSMAVAVSLISESGDMDSLTGTATTSPSFPASYLNEPEVTVRLPDGQARKFLISNVVGVTKLELVSNGDWLS